MLAENVNRASAGLQEKSLVFRTIALESTLPPHSDGAAHRVLERIESGFYPQREFLLHDLLACCAPQEFNGWYRSLTSLQSAPGLSLVGTAA
jgi:hypothetical protein